jgi:hypothetical protein
MRRSILNVGHTVSRTVGRMGVFLAVTLAALLVELLPLVGSSPGLASDLVVLSLAVLALAAAVDAASWSTAVVPGPGVFAPAPRSDPPVHRGPATDPVHHPLAPRAPGLA